MIATLTWQDATPPGPWQIGSLAGWRPPGSLQACRNVITSPVPVLRSIRRTAIRQPDPSPLQCPECGTLNPSGAMYCMICRAGLTQDATARHGTILDVLRDIAKRDPEGLVEALKNL